MKLIDIIEYIFDHDLYAEKKMKKFVEEYKNAKRSER